jgi:hypothetical protein
VVDGVGSKPVQSSTQSGRVPCGVFSKVNVSECKRLDLCFEYLSNQHTAANCPNKQSKSKPVYHGSSHTAVKQQKVAVNACSFVDESSGEQTIATVVNTNACSVTCDDVCISAHDIHRFETEQVLFE